MPKTTIAMEPYMKSFHLQTGLSLGSSSLHGKTGTGTSKPKHANAFSLKSTSYAGEGTFAEILEYNKHLAALKDFEELKNQYYDEYLENLEKKVLKQRRELTKKEEGSRGEPAEEAQEITLPKLKKLPHHRLTHDKDYMRKVTKSRFYHLLAARNLMEQRGLLKTRSDEDSFWDRVLHDHELWSHPVPSNIPLNTMTRVMVSRFSSVSRLQKMHGIRDRQHVTFCESSSKSSAAKDITDSNKTRGDSPTSIAFPKFRVKMKLPKLHSIKNISPPPSIKPTSAAIPDSNMKLRQLKKLRSIKHAYDVAMVNHAATAQILKRHGLLASKESDFFPQDLVCSSQTVLPPPLNEEVKLAPSRGKDKQVFMTEPVYGNDKVLIPDLEYKYPHGSVRKKVKTGFQTEEKLFGSAEKGTAEIECVSESLKVKNTEEDEVTPLNLHMMVAKGDLKIKEAKHARSLWVNYTNDDKGYSD